MMYPRRLSSLALLWILGARITSGIDAKIAESSPTRLTVDVFWGAAHSATTNALVRDGTTSMLFIDLHPVAVASFGSHASDALPQNHLLLDEDRTWGEEGFGTWGGGFDGWAGGFQAGTGIFANAPGVFHIDESYPGMDLAPTPFSLIPGLDIYGARFVFGSPYPVNTPPESAIPEGSLWLSVLPLGLVIGSVHHRRRKHRSRV